MKSFLYDLRLYTLIPLTFALFHVIFFVIASEIGYGIDTEIAYKGAE